MKIKFRLLITLVLLVSTLYAQSPDILFEQGRFQYRTDTRGNRVPDYSYCGYHASEDSIPDLSVQLILDPVAGDATQLIQQAIDAVSTLEPDAKGRRGVVLLQPGTYRIRGSIRIATSGVVLRGTDKTSVRLIKTGTEREALIYLEGTKDIVYGDTLRLVPEYVPIHASKFRLTTKSPLAENTRIRIVRTATQAWIDSLNCREFGAGLGYLGWKPGELDMNWDRTVSHSTNTTFSIRDPLPMALDPELCEVYVFPYQWKGRIVESGVEQLTLESTFDSFNPKDENHGWTGIYADNAEHCWIRQVDLAYFAGYGVVLHRGTSHITVEDCIFKDAIAETAGYRKVGFMTTGQLNLFQRCYSENLSHDFVAGYGAPGPNAFVQCESTNSLSFSGAISSWAPGLLFDNVRIDGNRLTFKNLGFSKQGAGWNTGNSMFWQCAASVIECFSPASDAVNRAYGCWGQYSGDGEWYRADSHIQPPSLFYTQLEERLGDRQEVNPHLLPRKLQASSSPSVHEAAELVRQAESPQLTLEEWINLRTIVSADIPKSKQKSSRTRVSDRKTNHKNQHSDASSYQIENGRIVFNHQLLTGAKQNVQWWSGNIRPKTLEKNRVKDHITRFVPGHEGIGLTDRIDSVVQNLKLGNYGVLEHNYGLWYERRRDDHTRVRREDGDVWTPFYEQPFARSGQGKAWDGLSLYDLTRPNPWYWHRMQSFVEKAGPEGILLFHQMFFQHNILEAGAHWVDSPWRTANNINHTDFPEPVRFDGDKRIFYAEMFYDTTHVVRKALYKNYIRECLSQLSDFPNVIHSISAEYTGPLHFMQFWLDVVREWEQDTGKRPLIALSATKDVQDAILQDSVRASVVDIIDIRYWHYKTDGSIYAPRGGQNLAPRQHARLVKTGKSGFKEVWKAVNEYRTLYPDKAVCYFGQGYPEAAWAVLLAGGSLPVISGKQLPPKLLSALAELNPLQSDISTGIYQTSNPQRGTLVFADTTRPFKLDLSPGKYNVYHIDPITHQHTVYQSSLIIKNDYLFNPEEHPKGIYWFEKL